MTRKELRRNGALVVILVLITAGVFSSPARIAADVALGDGKIIYGEGTVTTPRYRTWASLGWSGESSAQAAAATIRHVIVKAAPGRDELIAGIQTTGGVLYIERWDGSAWNSEWNATVGDGNLPRFDIAYEQTSGDALVMYGSSTAAAKIQYRTWNGSAWGNPATYSATRTSGVVHGLAATALGGSNDIAMVWGDANLDLSANYWDGANNVWKTEPSSALSTGLDTIAAAAALTGWSFDLEFESVSGELMVAWGNAAAAGIGYATRTAGAAGTWATSTVAGTIFAEQSDDLELSADPLSNYIILVHTGSDSGADMEAGVWNGSAWPGSLDTTPPCTNAVCALDISVDTTGAGTSGNAAGWVTSSSQTRGIVTYDDTNAAGIDWASYNKNTNTWALETDCTTSCNSQPASGDDKLHRIRMDPNDNSELMWIGVDTASDLFAKRLTFDGSTLTWASTEPGNATLEATMSSVTGLAADFAYNRFIPTATFTQAAYRWFNNLDTTDVGSALAAQDTTTTLASSGAAFRLRTLIHIGANQLASSGQSFKLQFAGKGSGACAAPSGGTPSAYTDVTATTTIAWNDNPSVADDDLLTQNANDPSHSGHTIVNQSYEEANNFTNGYGGVPSTQDGQWDFSLKDNGAAAATTYCLKIVKSNGSDIDAYSVYPEITTAASATISCSTDAATVSFGALSAGAVSTAAVNASTTMTCTGGTGCSLYIRDANAGLATSSPAYTINSSTATLAAGTEGYGVNATTTATGSGGALNLNITYGSSKWNTNQVGGLATSNVLLASSTAAVTGRETVVQHRAAIAATTPPASYADTITYECLGN